MFDDGERAPTPTPAPMPEPGVSSVSSVSMFGPDSQLINIGRSKHTFTGQLRRAIIAGDKHTQYPGCTAPPRMCEGHHSTQ